MQYCQLKDKINWSALLLIILSFINPIIDAFYHKLLTNTVLITVMRVLTAESLGAMDKQSVNKRCAGRQSISLFKKE